MSSPSFSPVRRAVCAVTAGPQRAAAWLVSSKGLFATSHAAVGYHTEVEVENESGDSRPARVVWVDLAHDLAILLADGALPRAAEPMAPLTLREVPSVKTGDRVFLVSALAGRGLRIEPASVCAAPKSSAGDLMDVDAPAVGPAGGPVVDADSRAVGIIVRSSISQSRAPSGRALVLPAAEIRSALRVLEAAPDLAKRTPVYRCPTCVTQFIPDHDVCLSCGTWLPHPFPPSRAHPIAERLVRDALASAGMVANRARTGPTTWHVTAHPPGGEAVPVRLVLSGDRTTFALRAPVAIAPKADREALYRLLLTINDQSAGPFRLSMSDDRVIAVFAQPIAMLTGATFPQTLLGIGEVAEHFRKILHEGFDAAPLNTLADPPDW